MAAPIGPTFSDVWYRVAPLRARVSPHAAITETARSTQRPSSAHSAASDPHSSFTAPQLVTRTAPSAASDAPRKNEHRPTGRSMRGAMSPPRVYAGAAARKRRWLSPLTAPDRLDAPSPAAGLGVARRS